MNGASRVGRNCRPQLVNKPRFPFFCFLLLTLLHVFCTKLKKTKTWLQKVSTYDSNCNHIKQNDEISSTARLAHSNNSYNPRILIFLSSHSLSDARQWLKILSVDEIMHCLLTQLTRHVKLAFGHVLYLCMYHSNGTRGN
jgi:hypothetical protein